MNVKDYTENDLISYQDKLDYLHYWLSFMFGEIKLIVEDTGINIHFELVLIDYTDKDGLNPHVAIDRKSLDEAIGDKIIKKTFEAIEYIGDYIVDMKLKQCDQIKK